MSIFFKRENFVNIVSYLPLFTVSVFTYSLFGVIFTQLNILCVFFEYIYIYKYH